MSLSPGQMDNSMQLLPSSGNQSAKQKLAVALGLAGLFILVLALINVNFPNKKLWLAVALISITVGTALYANFLYLHKPAGVQMNGIWHKSLTSRGIAGWVMGICLTGLYVFL